MEPHNIQNFQSYSLNFNGGLCNFVLGLQLAHELSSFCQILYKARVIYLHFLLSDTTNVLFLDVLDKDLIIMCGF